MCVSHRIIVPSNGNLTFPTKIQLDCISHPNINDPEEALILLLELLLVEYLNRQNAVLAGPPCHVLGWSIVGAGYSLTYQRIHSNKDSMSFG